MKSANVAEDISIGRSTETVFGAGEVEVEADGTDGLESWLKACCKMPVSCLSRASAAFNWSLTSCARVAMSELRPEEAAGSPLSDMLKIKCYEEEMSENKYYEAENKYYKAEATTEK